MRDYFYLLADFISEQLRADEFFICLLRGEDSDFVRLNNTRIRQAGHVHQLELGLELIEGARHVAAQLNLSGVLEKDRTLIIERMNTLRAQLAVLDDDPYLLYASEVHSTEEVQTATLPPVNTLIPEIIEIANGLDMVGIWASGTQFQGFANSLGQRNWHSTQRFNFDWSCYFNADKAIKSNFSGSEWDTVQFNRQIVDIRLRLERFDRPAYSPKAGGHRAYLAPSALQEILALVGWGGFSLKSHRTRQTPLIKMTQQNQRLHPSITLIENHAAGLTSKFTSEGFIKPAQVSLIHSGEYQSCLVSPRSSREYGVPMNAALEVPESMELTPGELNETDVLTHLETGLYISNLWYCNYSDRNDCRITGMTRYACFWVENGELAAPLNVMRFDDSVYRILGDKLIGLTRERHTLIDPGSYERRSTSSMKLPGVLVDDFTLTL